jgi:hypothetical protein
MNEASKSYRTDQTDPQTHPQLLAGSRVQKRITRSTLPSIEDRQKNPCSREPPATRGIRGALARGPGRRSAATARRIATACFSNSKYNSADLPRNLGILRQPKEIPLPERCRFAKQSEVRMILNIVSSQSALNSTKMPQKTRRLIQAVHVGDGSARCDVVLMSLLSYERSVLEA